MNCKLTSPASSPQSELVGASDKGRQSLLRAALGYAELGYPVFPCRPQTKKPLTKHGFLDASSNPQTIEQWWNQNPQANIGIPTEGLLVIDIDGQNNSWLVDDPDKMLDLANTAMSLTANGGRHYIFRQPKGKAWRGSTGKLAAKVDIRANGNYIVVPPSVLGKGKVYRWAETLELDGPASSLPEPPVWLIEELDRAATLAQGATSAPSSNIIPAGQRNSSLASLAGRLRRAGKGETEILIALQRANVARCQPPLADREVETIAASIMKYPPPGSQQGSHALTDSGNAELLAELHSDRLRYDHRRCRWLVWSGHYWREDVDGEPDRAALDVARRRQQIAVHVDDPDQRRAVFVFGVRSENRQRRGACIALAKSTRPIADAGEDWNAKPLLLACKNGVIDLSTGQLRAGRQDDRLTLAVPHAFSSTATCPRWERFLKEVLPASDVRRFVARAIGYSITGLTREQCWFLLSGTGCNGKTTLLRALADTLGPLALNLPFSSFTARHDTRATNDLASIVGRRLVTASESGEVSALDEARIKALSGQDTITARFLYGEYFEFRPVCKIWLCCNMRPAVRDDSYAFWRRVRCIDFPRRFGRDEIDRDLPALLAAESTGIFAWSIRKATEYLKDGLEPPEVVTLATDDYRRDTDPLADFLNECCCLEPDRTADFRTLYTKYGQWADDLGLKDRDVLSKNAFGRRLGSKFRKSRPAGRGVVYHGIAAVGAQS